MAAILVPGQTLGRARAFVTALAASGAATAVYAPWVPILVQQSRSGVDAWIRRFWEATPPSVALLRSFEVVGVGGAFPSYLGELGALQHAVTAPEAWLVLRIAGALLGGGLVIGGFVAAIRQGPSERDAAIRIALFLVLPLALAWAVSFIVRPIYLVGRYEMVAFSAYAILAARGFAALVTYGVGGVQKGAAGASHPTAVAAAVALLWLAGAGLCLVAYHGAQSLPAFLEEKRLAEWLRDNSGPKDAVILPGYTRAVPEYYLTLWASAVQRISFPPDVGRHYGWFDYERALRESAATRNQAAALAMEAWNVIDRGGRVFLVAWSRRTPNKINLQLEDELTKQFGKPRVSYPTRAKSLVIAIYGTR